MPETIVAWEEELVGGSQRAATSQMSDDEEAAKAAVADTLLLSISRPAMACEFEVLLNQYQYPDGADHAMSALDLIEEFEASFSVYRARSDFSTVNRFGAERPIPVSFDSFQLLSLAQAIHHWTESAFDITAGSLSEVWGFARRQGRKPEDTDIAEALTRVGADLVRLDDQNSQVSLGRPGVTLNPGGIGKGYALDRAAGRLLEAGIEDFMMHGGLSSIAARGNRLHRDAGGGWNVSLKHPLRWEQHLGTIRLKDMALGTSGSGKQFFHFKGRRYSHIIDPRSGWPAQGMLSATVLCRSAAIADALATGLFVMGPKMACEFCERHKEISAILVVENEKSGRQEIITLNVGEEMWQPA